MSTVISKEDAYQQATTEVFSRKPKGTWQQVTFEAMDIWAKHQSIELIKFMYASCAETIPNTRPAKWNIDLNTEVTFEELYQLFLDKQSNQ